ncbi:heterodisulfide reductase-related iron-sulfur binding cluster [Magnetospirillum sp. UT-4]|uniref:heterodisulfide reductase-related iron-sulfur binding cluster n=1 Tax=Magnetospirillum sp. UT-4 TaxID=2681467 RepID=UPI0013863055|nr:heterodisulfide reductase-related iron-sulfur binding cluster [Magnetospirillum sp. UT-4]CAA7627071.1 Anaerobic glycerol-3-phosphate dehydrogenase subunit C [Magnetospirillum sp. UT-4]
MREGSLDAPTRHPVDWRNPDFLDPVKLDAEMRRVFEICHGCRRCFNLCESFPRLFDMIDAAGDAELAGVKSERFAEVTDACTLCDMCFMTKCPYVPPHQFNLDVPHLILRYRAYQAKRGEVGLVDRQLTETDRNGRLGCGVASGVANWATRRGNSLTRPLMQAVAGIHKEAALPEYARRTLVEQAAAEPPEVNKAAPAHGRKAVLYATCFANYNNPAIGMAARAVLARNGVETELVYPECCGMPQLEHGDFARVADKAKAVAAALVPWIDKGYDVVALVPSCALMLKFEWPLIVPGDEVVAKLARATFDIPEYVMDMAAREGLAEGLKPLEGPVTIHLACHARAQNMGRKAAQMLGLIPDTKVEVIERCSGHGGSWGIKREWFDIGLKVGKPVARQAAKLGSPYVVSECPLAREHILQGMAGEQADTSAIRAFQHPIQLLAHAYGL